MDKKKPLVYLAGDIMTRGSNLAREEEYQKFKEAKLDVDVYSPVMNKSINDKSNMTEEENNHLAEKIVEADVERLWNSDYTILCPEQSAIGTMCEMGILYGWKYLVKRLLKIRDEAINDAKDWYKEERAYWNTHYNSDSETEFDPGILHHITDYLINIRVSNELIRLAGQKTYAHYFDIRTNHLNEKDWRRSFSINQFLYGIILEATADNTLHNSFDEIIPILQKEFKEESN